jgi:predicted PurR-regulated permease PerM
VKWFNRIDRRYLKISLYVVGTAVTIYCLSLIANHASDLLSGIVNILGWIFKVLTPLFIGFAMAYILQPINNFFERHLSRRKLTGKHARGLAVLITLLIFLSFFTAVISALVFSITNQIKLASFDDFMKALEKLFNNGSSFYKQLLERLDKLNIKSDIITDYISKVSDSLSSAGNLALTGVVGFISDVSSSLTTILFGIIIGIYFMIDSKMITAYLSDTSSAILGEKKYNKIVRILDDLDTVFSGYIRGQLMDVLFMMVSVSVSLVIAGVPMAPMIGVLTGLANLVPYLGPIVAYASVIIVCVVNAKYETMIIGLIVVLVIQTLDGNVIEPKFLSKSIEIHPLLVVIFLIIGAAVGGVWGMLLAVPVGGYVKIIFGRFVSKKKAARLKEAENNETVSGTENIANEPVKEDTLNEILKKDAELNGRQNGKNKHKKH